VFWTVAGERKDGFVYDIGLGGCFLNSSGLADADDEIVLEIPKPPDGEKVVRFRCIVVPQKRRLKGFGLRFLALTEAQKAVIADFLAKPVVPPDRRG